MTDLLPPSSHPSDELGGGEAGTPSTRVRIVLDTSVLVADPAALARLSAGATW